jgi:inosine/xanthosine triphosphate pyrophosphatase family protein
MAPPKELNFITGNKNKLAEVQAILSETAVDLRSQAVDLVEIQGTIEEISRDKAIRAAEAVCLLFFHFSVSQTVFYTGIFSTTNGNWLAEEWGNLDCSTNASLMKWNK